MNTLPIQTAAPANASADAASKGRASESPDAESPFRQVLKDEIAERRQTQADASPQAPKSEKSAPSAQARPAADAGREKEEAELASTEARPEDMTQYLVLTSQFVQPVSNPQATSPKGAATAASAPVDAALDGGEASAALLPLPKPLAEPNAQQPSQRVTTAPGDAQPANANFAAAVDSARLAQQPASAAPENGVQQGTIVAEAPAPVIQAAEQAPEIQQSQQPPSQAVSSAALHQAGVERQHGHSDQTADRIAPRVATPAWNQAIGQKVVWMVGNEQQSAALTLNPPDLGPLQVVISVSENKATANFVSAHPEVRQALEAAMPRLREMLGEAGVQLGQTHVGAGTSGEYGTWKQQQFAQPAPNHGEAVFSALPGATQSAQAIRRGLVDTFA